MAKYGSFKYGMEKYGKIMLVAGSSILNVLVKIAKKVEAYVAPRVVQRQRITLPNGERIHQTEIQIHLPIKWNTIMIDSELTGEAHGDIKLENGHIVPKEGA